MRYLFVLLALAGCAGFKDDYAPHLKSQPKDLAKYEQDRKECIAEARIRHKKSADDLQNSGGGLLIGGFGLLGYGAHQAFSDSEKDYNKTPMQMADECLIERGYKIYK